MKEALNPITWWRPFGEYSKPTKDFDRNKRLLSRKWLLSLGTLGGLFYCGIADVGLTTAECAAIVVPTVAYVFGESWVDGRRSRSDERTRPVAPREVSSEEREETVS